LAASLVVTLTTMTDPLYDEPSYLTELPEDLKLKRATAARRRRWRRRLAIGALVAVLGAIVALVFIERIEILLSDGLPGFISKLGSAGAI
jgi:ferric-dicitrate binding protein FerR (iron transport regulator)